MSDKEDSNAEAMKRKRADSTSVDEDQPKIEASANPEEEEESADNMSKRTKLNDRFSSLHGFYLVSQTPESMLFEIMPSKVGHVIGSKGMIIVELCNRSGAKISVNQDFPPGVMRQVTITGEQQQMEAAADLIRRLVEFGPTGIHQNTMAGGPQMVKTIDCSQQQVGKIIGSNGANIKEIQTQSGAKVQVHQNFPPDVPRKVEITGTKLAIDAAEKLIRAAMALALNGPSGGGGGQHAPKSFDHGNAAAGGRFPYQQQQQQQHARGGFPPAAGGFGAYGAMPPAAAQHTPQPGDVHHVIEVPKALVGRLIGKGAENIRFLQTRSGCRVNVMQNVPEGQPCKVNIQGNPHNVSIASALVKEIENGIHTSQIGHTLPQPISGGMPAPFGGMPGYGAPPAHGAFPSPYGMPPAAPMAQGFYGAPGAVGAAAGGYDYYGAYRQPGAAPAASPYGAPQQQQHAFGAPAAAHGYGASAVGAASAAAANTKGDWSEHKTDDGTPYWYNGRTRESQWTRPPGF